MTVAGNLENKYPHRTATASAGGSLLPQYFFYLVFLIGGVALAVFALGMTGIEMVKLFENRHEVESKTAIAEAVELFHYAKQNTEGEYTDKEFAKLFSLDKEEVCGE